jgi:hypothetical protein
VANLDQQHLWSQNCKKMLLEPRNSMEAHHGHLKLNIDDTPTLIFLCENSLCRSGVSIFRNQKCQCGKVLKTDCRINHQNGFVKKSPTFIIYSMILQWCLMILEKVYICFRSKESATLQILRKKQYLSARRRHVFYISSLVSLVNLFFLLNIIFFFGV